MKEQIGRVARAASLGEYEVCHASPTTPKELGIEIERDERLALNREPFQQMVSFKDPRSGDVVYLASFHHPFSGFHFSQLLNAVAHFKSGPDGLKGGILNDFDMPPPGFSTIIQDYPRLRRIHEEDPEVGISYKKFVKERLEPWTANLRNEISDPIFRQLERLRILNDESINFVFSNLLSSLKEDVSTEPIRKMDILSNIFYRLGGGDLHTAFIKFLQEQPETQKRESRKDGGFDTLKHGYFPHNNVDDITYLSRLMPRFLEQLDVPLRRELLVFMGIGRGDSTIVSVRDQKAWNKKKDIALSFVDGPRLELSDQNGTSIEVSLQQDQALNSSYLDYYVSKYNFPQETLQDALYPIIAWAKNENGERRFISQEELETFKPLIDLDYAQQADVYLGRVLLADFSPDLTDEWKNTIPLEHGRYPQEMMPAQVAVWVSLDSSKYPHAQQLLSHPNVQKLEAHMGIS